jgi:hypothetical protein
MAGATLDIQMQLGITRPYPLTAKKIDHVESRKLNFNQLHDCLAGKKLMPNKDKRLTEHGFFNIKSSCDKKKA